MDDLVERVARVGKRRARDDGTGKQEQEQGQGQEPAAKRKPTRTPTQDRRKVDDKRKVDGNADPDDAASPMRVTDKAWVWVRPRVHALDHVIAKREGRAGKWTVYTRDDNEHTARWRVIREKVAQGKAGYMAGATTAYKTAGYEDSCHVISVHVGDADNAKEHERVLSVIRSAGANKTVYFKLEGAKEAVMYCRDETTTACLCDLPAPAPAVPTPAPAAPATMAKPESGAIDPYDCIDWSDPAVIAQLDAAECSVATVAKETVKLASATFVVAMDKDWVFMAAVRNTVHAAAAAVGITSVGAVTLVFGDGKGAERFAIDEARSAGYKVVMEPAKWSTEGNGAGKKRNMEVMTKYKPVALLVFPSPDATARVNTNSWLTAARATSTAVRYTYHDTLAAESKAKVKANIAVAAVTRANDVLDGITGDMVDGWIAEAGGRLPPPPPQELTLDGAMDDDAMSALVTMAQQLQGADTPQEARCPFVHKPHTLLGLLDPDTVSVPNPAHHAAIVRPPRTPTSTIDSASVSPVPATEEDLSDKEGEPHVEVVATAAVEEEENASSTIGRIVGAVAMDVTPTLRQPFAPRELALMTAKPKPRKEWLTYEEFYTRFVMLEQEQADVIARAPQGTDTPSSVVDADFAMPAELGTVKVMVGSAKPFAVGLDVFVVGAGFFHVEKRGTGILVLTNHGIACNAAPGSIIPAGARVSVATWLLGRMYAITASQFGAAIGVSPYQDPVGKTTVRGVTKYGLLEEKLWDMFSGNEMTRWGNDHEADARDSFAAWFRGTWLRQRYEAAGKTAAEYKQAHAVSRVLEFGLLAFPQTPWMRVSPDGVALFLDVDGVVRVALVEFKCPYNLWDTLDHPYVKHPKNTPPQYYAQIQGIMGFLNMDKHQAGWRDVLSSHVRQAWHNAQDAEDDTQDIHAEAEALHTLVKAFKAKDAVDARFTECFFVVWQPRQLWITRRTYDAPYFDGTVFPALKKWYFKRFLPAATHRHNGRLAFGETTPQQTVIGDLLTDAQLAAAAQSAALAANDKDAAVYPQWKADNVESRLRQLADAYADGYDVGVLQEFAEARDSKGLLKVEGLRRGIATALETATDDKVDAIAYAATTLLKDAAGVLTVKNLEWQVLRTATEVEANTEGNCDAVEEAEAKVVADWICADPPRVVDAIFDLARWST